MSLLKSLVVSLFLVAVCISQITPAHKVRTSAQRAPEHTVSVLISATDAHGNPVRDLAIDQVTVMDNNQPAQTMRVVDASSLPLDLGIVLLASKEKFGQEQAAAIDLAQKVLRPGKDKAFVVTAAGDKSWPNPKLNWLTEPSAVADTVRGLDKNAGLPDLFSYVLSTSNIGIDRQSIQSFNTGGGFSFFNVVWAMMKTDPAPARRAVVIFRLPSAHAPGWGERNSRACEENHNYVIQTAQSLGVSFYTIGLDDQMPGTNAYTTNIQHDYQPIHNGNSVGARQYDADMDKYLANQYRAGRENISRIADETGGHAYWTLKKNYADAVAAIENELSGRYVISFVPPDKSAESSIHPIKIQVSGAAHVSAPRAYIVQPAGQ
jgi:VWFA-related protein